MGNHGNYQDGDGLTEAIIKRRRKNDGRSFMLV